MSARLYISSDLDRSALAWASQTMSTTKAETVQRKSTRVARVADPQTRDVSLKLQEEKMGPGWGTYVLICGRTKRYLDDRQAP
jgi:hypothetical protein